MEARIRCVTPDDAAQIHSIYRPYVTSTSISFELNEPSVDEVRRRIADISTRYPWFVCCLPEGIAGYAYATRHRERAAYQWDVEVSAYVRTDHHHRGIGSGLYSVLFKVLKGLGYYNAFAGISLPNAASVAFHEKMGFQKIGVFKDAGYKFDAWHDVGWWQLALREKGDRPTPPADFETWVQHAKEYELTEE
jgi:L-amino acid N-acyltransferase YncA